MSEITLLNYSEIENGKENSNANIQSFSKENLGSVRIITLDNEPMFCLSDVAKVLEHSNPARIREWLDVEFGKGITKSYTLETKGGKQSFVFITEPQLYYVLARTNVPKAKPFRMWVNGEVLPSIRKTGGYNVAQKLPQTYAEALRELADKVEKVAELENKVAQDKPKVEYADNLLSASNSVSFAGFGKMLGSKGIKMGQNRLFALLREWQYLMSNNEPYQKYIDCGYFELLPQSYNTGSKTITTYKTLITAKGQYHFTNKILHKG